MSQNNESASMQARSRVHHWSKERLVEAWHGCQRRLGTTFTLASTEVEVKNLVKASTDITDSKKETFFFWTIEVMAEIKYRLAAGDLSIKEEEGGTHENIVL